MAVQRAVQQIAAAVQHGGSAELEAQIAQQYAECGALVLREATQEDIAVATAQLVALLRQLTALRAELASQSEEHKESAASAQLEAAPGLVHVPAEPDWLVQRAQRAQTRRRARRQEAQENDAKAQLER